MDWVADAERLKFDDGLSWTAVYDAVRPYFPDLTDKQVEEKVRGALRRSDRYPKITKAGRPVGVIGDIHAPFDHPGYLRFLQDTFKAFKVGRKVFIGDLFDHYSYSRFVKKPLAMNPKQEKEMARERISKYCEAFPKADVILGNHDTRYIDRAEEFGIDSELIRGFKDIYGLPKGWNIYDEYENFLIIDDVLYIHGSAYNGQHGAKQAALNEQMSVVMGHGHSFAGVWPIANKRKLMFGMNVGCGIDIGAYAFAYNKKDKFRPLLGCGIVFNSSYAIWVPMGSEYFRD
jgi:metallophosphoesterase superfamily enzyme